MPDAKTKFRVFLSAAEPSGDAHCAGLIAAIKARCRLVARASRPCFVSRASGPRSEGETPSTRAGGTPATRPRDARAERPRHEIEFVGMGGPKMAKAGCELLENTVGEAAMIYKAFTQVARYYRLLGRIKRFLASNKVDLVIVCDSPSFNFHVAKAGKKSGARTLFFVAPQLWAWGSWRIRKLRKCCDKLCCLLPFEQDWFGSRGVDAVFVGNPLMDKLTIDPTHHEKYAGFEPVQARIALMPGSRPAEIDSLWKPMQEIALRLKAKYAEAAFVAVAVDAERQRILQNTQVPGFECDYSIDSVNRTAAAVDFSIVASGSATLEVAAAGCPMVVMYQSSRILWHLAGRWLIKTKYLSLVNILAGRELIPEFMPYFTSIEPIVASIDVLLRNSEALGELSRRLTELTMPLARKNACEEVAGIVVKELGLEN